MIEKKIDDFDLMQICRSGQCFRMKEIGQEKYCMIAGNRYLEADQNGNKVKFYCNEEEFEEFWKNYFDLEQDYAAYKKMISPKDLYLSKAAEFGGGIRILNQDLWEMIVSFLISQQNNIGRIRKCIENICEEYGEKLISDTGKVFYGFPAPETLAYLDEDELKKCNLGYRSKYVVRTARMVVEGTVDLGKIRTMPYRKAKTELLKLFGVGEKVADCICLFALHDLQAFPVDTHIRQALDAHYIKGFPKTRYKGCEGVMQQYIFYYELFGKKMQ